MRKLHYLLSTALAFSVLAFTACQEDETPPTVEEPETPTLVEAANEANLTILLDAVETVPGLSTTLMQSESITVFAPTNGAFENALNAFEVDDLDGLVEELGGVNELETVLGFHVVPATAFSTDLEEGENTFTTLAGQELTVVRSGEAVTVTDATGNTVNVINADVEIENGVVHVIDGVLLPELE
ncbi:fasciclin domain-containing protein [Arthrospiribacter ruber]|uniref:Fasciclin domain-containing protein n=1 Tax=Arthrospiribacter ruber TaxID=2487934 RepID=A0A951MHP7_9BACT|nr:fasciclin domain-containing protein [Arthrospiribacter ruber]MBW3469491.1 fasciclin domain-containing protein [Arthrospiribacter ruber]